MKQIATLGPKGTFSDIAATQYLQSLDEEAEVFYCKSMKATIQAIEDRCDAGILPIENFSEGFVSLVLDLIVDAELYITGEILLPIHFSFVSHAASRKNIKKLYVQFVAKNQCIDFIESLGDVEVITTESNIESLELALAKDSHCAGAVVPAHSHQGQDFNLIVDNINDYEHNQTRFLVLSKKENGLKQPGDNIHYKTSIIVLNDDDHPGLLERILAPFSQREINLTAITSRPTRKKFGRYNFFMGFDGHQKDPNIAEALRELKSHYRIKILGSYPKAINSTKHNR